MVCRSLARPSVCLPVSPFVRKRFSSALSLPFNEGKLVLKFSNDQRTC